MDDTTARSTENMIYILYCFVRQIMELAIAFPTVIVCNLNPYKRQSIESFAESLLDLVRLSIFVRNLTVTL